VQLPSPRRASAGAPGLTSARKAWPGGYATGRSLAPVKFQSPRQLKEVALIYSAYELGQQNCLKINVQEISALQAFHRPRWARGAMAGRGLGACFGKLATRNNLADIWSALGLTRRNWRLWITQWKSRHSGIAGAAVFHVDQMTTGPQGLRARRVGQPQRRTEALLRASTQLHAVQALL